MKKKRKQILAGMSDEYSNIDFEIAFFEGVVNKSPEFLEALMALGDLYTRKGRYPDGLAIDERLARLRGEDPFILYNLACSYALLGSVAQAAETMKKAIACGYRDFARLERDRDLLNLLSDEGFQKYLKSQKRKRSSSATNP